MTDRFYRMSAVRKFKRCRRAFWWQYGIGGFGLEEPTSDTPASGQRDVGTLAHLGVQAIYQGNDWRATLAAEKAKLALVMPISPEWEKVYKLAERMVEGFAQWRDEEGIDAGYETIHIEERFNAFAGNYHGDDVYLTCKPDRIARETVTGAIVLDDWKTVASLDRPATLDIDDQKLTYGWVMEVNGLKPLRFYHTQLKKVQRTAQAKPPFYKRHEVTYSEDQRAVHRQHLAGTLSDLVLAVQRAEADPDAHHSTLYPNPTRDCSWDCDFLMPCQMIDQGDDAASFLNVNFRPRKAPSE